MINGCGGRIGNANFRSAPRMVSQDAQADPLMRSVIPYLSVVELTDQTSGEWIGFGGMGQQGISVAVGDDAGIS